MKEGATYRKEQFASIEEMHASQRAAGRKDFVNSESSKEEDSDIGSYIVVA
jgi:hypothetical protein